MADLSLLMGRRGGNFAVDARYGRADAAGDTPAPIPVPDPLTDAHASGFAEGIAAGCARTLADAVAEQGIREKLCFNFARLDAELAEALRQRLLDTVVALCEATLVPLTLDLPALARRVERAATMFARADDERVIRLNPEDLSTVQPLLPQDWTFTPDPALERGALRVESRSGGAEDGPEQWRRAIAEALDLC